MTVVDSFFTGFFVKLKRNIKWVENAILFIKVGLINET